MDKSHPDIASPDHTPGPDDETSAFVGTGSEAEPIDLGGLFSNRFSNVRLLYRSPNGTADLYTATRYGRRFVLKALKEHFAHDTIPAMAMAKEFEIGISLEHPTIRRTLGLETVDGIGRAIVLEYIDGVTLAELMASGSLTSISARRILEEIRQGLIYMHARGIIHRDLKPSNILITHNGAHVRIIDFSLSDSPEFVVLKNPAGSRRYMAPEQLASPTPTAGPSADIYSFGVIVGEIASALSDTSLAALAERLTATDPRQRPASADEIDLSSTAPGFADRMNGWLSSVRLTWILSTICTALIIIIFILAHR